jgi:PAS domain S-box-containing protein
MNNSPSGHRKRRRHPPDRAGGPSPGQRGTGPIGPETTTDQALRLEEARLDALLRLSQMVDAPLNEITAFALEQAIALTRSKIGFVGFLNEDESVYTLHAVSKDVVKECAVAGAPLQWHVAEAGIWADAIRQRKTLFVNDYGKPHPRKHGLPSGHPNVQRFMVTPFLDGERVVAVAGVGNKESDYDKSDERQVVLLLNGMWASAQKSRSREELQKAYSELEERVEQRTAQLRESEEQARRRAEELEGLMDVLPTAVWISLDPNCDVIVGNRAANSFYEAYEGENVSANRGEPGAVRRFFQSGREVAADELPMQKAAATGKAVRDCDLEVLMPSGKRLSMFGHAIPLFDAEGRVRGSIAVFVDITERKRMEEALRESEERYRSLLQTAPDAIIVHRDGKLLYANPAALRLYGASSFEELASHNILDLVAPEEAETVSKRMRTLMAGRNVPLREGSIIRLDGVTVPIEVMSSSIQYEGGTAAQAMIRDITERKQAEKALARANERTQRLLSANVIGIAEFDATKIVSANRAFVDMTGYSAREIARGRVDWREMTPPEYAERDNRAWREMIEHGECLPYEKEYITRDGRRLPILIAGVRLTEDPVTGVFLNLDITDWKLMERELLETTHFAEHLFDSSLIGLTRLNDEGLLDANDAFLDMVGYTREDLRAGLIDVRAMTPPEYAALDDQAMIEMLAVGEATPYEKEYIRKDGSRVPVLIGRKLIKESPLEWVAFVLDLTERKAVEADLERVRTDFLGEISHELKTPITAIKGCASMALSSGTPPDPAEARELFEVVDTQANRLTDLVGNLLDMTRIESGRLSIEPEEIDVGKVIDEARVVFEHSRYPHSLQVDVPPKLPRVRADSRRIVQVLTNLCSNAAKFSSPRTPIVVSAEHRDNEVVVHVRDDGAGIPADKMPLLFQKFAQIHTVGTKGTGLGLFICKGIVEAQGGRIWAESAGEGEGATFSFALPAVIAGRAGMKGARAGKPAGGAGRRQRRVVAIDDEPHILRYLEHCLKNANYAVASTTDPLAAAKLVKSENPDIVLLDMRLPGASGLKVLEEIRQFSSVPVAFITATANREDVLRGRQFGGTTWLEKPFSREDLLRHVAGVLARRRRRKR